MLAMCQQKTISEFCATLSPPCDCAPPIHTQPYWVILKGFLWTSAVGLDSRRDAAD